MRQIPDFEIVGRLMIKGSNVPDTSAPGILSLLLTVLVEFESE